MLHEEEGLGIARMFVFLIFFISSSFCYPVAISISHVSQLEMNDCLPLCYVCTSCVGKCQDIIQAEFRTPAIDRVVPHATNFSILTASNHHCGPHSSFCVVLSVSMNEE